MTAKDPAKSPSWRATGEPGNDPPESSASVTIRGASMAIPPARWM